MKTTLCGPKSAHRKNWYVVLFLALAIAPSGCKASTSATPAAPQATKVVQGSSPQCTSVTSPFTGTLCSPGDGQRYPAILLFGGSQGGDAMRDTARAFASRGYVAGSVVYFGVSNTPPSLVEVPVEVGGRAIQGILQRADVDPSRVALMGSSKGGEYALLVASTYSEVKAVVAYAPTPFAWFGLGEGSMPTGCSWSQGGKALACVPQDPVARQEVGQLFMSHRPIAFRSSYEQSRAHSEVVKSAFFPLERIRGPVLCLAGDDDQMWNSRAHCEMAMGYLHDHHHPFSDRMISYPNAGHLFIVAQSGPSSAMNSVRSGSFEMLFGGTPEGDAQAGRAVWPEIDAFLVEAFHR